MMEAIESVVSEEHEMSLRARGKGPVPSRVPGSFVVDMLEETGTMGRGEAELLLSWFEWVELEVRGEPGLLEGIDRLRGAVMKAAACGAGRVA